MSPLRSLQSPQQRAPTISPSRPCQADEHRQRRAPRQRGRPRHARSASLCTPPAPWPKPSVLTRDPSDSRGRLLANDGAQHAAGRRREPRWRRGWRFGATLPYIGDARRARRCPASREGVGVMSKTTRATLALDEAAVLYTVQSYDYDPNAEQIGVQAAESLGVPAAIVLKTLMAEVDGKPVCLLIPSDRGASMKKVASAFAGKSAQMMRPAEAERLTGYHVGGISPFGQKRRVPTALDASAIDKPRVFVNGGQRGLQIELPPV